MDKFVKHVQRLREEAQALVNSGTSCTELEEEAASTEEGRSCLNCGGDNWIRNLRRKAGEWKGKPLVVLSLFDGIGGVWAALNKLGIPFSGYSCEVCDEAIEVTKRRYSTVRHLGDIRKLKRGDIKEKLDLVIGGFPCQDLSAMGVKLGLHGNRSRLFFDMLRVIKTFSPTWFLAENVASMSWVDREEITKHLSTTPIEIDAQKFSPCKRRRLYWSNIPYPKLSPRVKDSEGTSLQSIVQKGVALAGKNSCILTMNGQGTGKCSVELVYDSSQNTTRYINVLEVELMMGYPPHHTNVGFQSNLRGTSGVDRTTRWRLLGNTFSVPVISYILSPLLELEARKQTRKYHLPSSVREQDCSVMIPGEVNDSSKPNLYLVEAQINWQIKACESRDPEARRSENISDIAEHAFIEVNQPEQKLIWAMYNSHQRPNWYAQIVSRSGERFDESGYEPGMKSSRLPLRIEVKFLELTKPYETGERDLWNTVRGSGLYYVTKEVHLQESWVTFSHLVSSMIKMDNDHYFIYPGQGEVWSVYDRGTEGRYLVYVVESSVNKQSAKKGIRGKEDFSARCRLLQKKTELDLYSIIEKELIYTDLGVFSFRAPYSFFTERDTLKIELSVKHRDRGAYSDKLNRKRSRRQEESDDEDLFDIELEGVGGDTAEI